MKHLKLTPDKLGLGMLKYPAIVVGISAAPTQQTPSSKTSDSNPVEDPDSKVAIGASIDLWDYKDFINYGRNRVLSLFKTQRETDWKVNEKMEGMKPTKDWMKYVVIISIMLIIGVVCYILIMQYSGANEAKDAYANCKASLAACSTRLDIAGNASRIFANTLAG